MDNNIVDYLVSVNYTQDDFFIKASRGASEDELRKEAMRTMTQKWGLQSAKSKINNCDFFVNYDEKSIQDQIEDIALNHYTVYNGYYLDENESRSGLLVFRPEDQDDDDDHNVVRLNLPNYVQNLLSYEVESWQTTAELKLDNKLYYVDLNTTSVR